MKIPLAVAAVSALGALACHLLIGPVTLSLAGIYAGMRVLRLVLS